MKKIGRWFWAYIIVASCAQAQTNTYSEINEKTAQFLIEKDWQKIRTESKEAIKQGIDFYDLRLRCGLACLNQQKYRKAIEEFAHCKRFFPTDTLATYYTALASLLLGNQAAAKQNATYLPDSWKKNLRLSSTNLLEVGVLGSFSFFDAQNKAQDLLQKETGEWNGYRGLVGGSAYIRYRAGKRLTILHSAGSFVFQNFKKAYYPNQKVMFFNDGVQIGGSSIVSWALPKKYSLQLNVQYNHIGTYTQTFNTAKGIYEVTNFSKGGLLLGGSVEKSIQNIDVLGGVYWNNFLNYYTLQGTCGVTYYPFSNARLTLRGQFSWVENLAEQAEDYRRNLLFLFKANVQVHKSVWWSASYLHGNTLNFFDTENNAIYYTADRTRQTIQTNLHLLAGKHLRFNAGYTLIQRESYQFNLLNLALPLKPISYNAHQINVGSTWFF